MIKFCLDSFISFLLDEEMSDREGFNGVKKEEISLVKIYVGVSPPG